VANSSVHENVISGSGESVTFLYSHTIVSHAKRLLIRASGDLQFMKFLIIQFFIPLYFCFLLSVFGQNICPSLPWHQNNVNTRSARTS
jgi:hypothetical protein